MFASVDINSYYTRCETAFSPFYPVALSNNDGCLMTHCHYSISAAGFLFTDLVADQIFSIGGGQFNLRVVMA